MENAEVARILAEMADIYEILGVSGFKVRALRNAAETVETTGLNVIGMAQSGGVKRLREIAGIGEGIAKRIVELGQRGALKEHEELATQVPRTLLQLLDLPGVGPKKVKLFQDELGVKGLDDLELAARGGRVQALPRMGKKSEDKLLVAIERYRARTGRFSLYKAHATMMRVLDVLRTVPGIERLEPAGSYRRRRESVGDLDVLCICDDAQPVMDCFAKLGELIGRGPTKCSVRLVSGLNVDLRVVGRDSFGAALHYFTGSKAHNVAVRTMAVRRGLTINEYGVFELGDDGEAGARIGGATEEEVFAAVGLPWIPPELRENLGEIDAGAQGRLPDLVRLEQIKGDVHMHTEATDGSASVRAMAEAAAAKGYRYIAITDHSKALAMTGGLDEVRLRAQGEEIRRVDAELGGRIRVLRGIEVDILQGGELDLAADALGELDVVVASVHSRLDMPRDEMTQRLIRAIESGSIDVVGHPTGRVLGRRDPCPLDMEAVMRAAASRGVALEVSASPSRLDLSDAHCRLARDLGVKLVVNTDAHHPDSLDFMAYGIDQARRGWLTSGDVLNTRDDAGAFLAALHGGHR